MTPSAPSELIHDILQPTVRPLDAFFLVRKLIDTAALEQLHVHFSQLVVVQPWIKEIDINPVLASLKQLLAIFLRSRKRQCRLAGDAE